MDVIDTAGELASDLLRRGQAAAAVLAGAVVYLIGAKRAADIRAEKRTDETIAVIATTNEALKPLAPALEGVQEAVHRLERQLDRLDEKIDRLPDRMRP